MKTLYITRHGQTLFNVLHRVQGASDSPLTALGIKQAIRAQAFIENVAFDHAYTSTQERASDTLELLLNGKLPYERMKGLKEMNFGVFEGQSEQLNPPVADYDTFFAEHNYGGETRKQVAERMNQTVLEIMNRSDNHTVLIVSHGAAIVNFLALYFDKSQFSSFGNLATVKLHFDENKQTFSLEELFRLAEQMSVNH
ncbi:phosphoglycerate mutase [Lactococcus hodotermopsidis]|uniref:Phosphoglycerate mutase n=2 Tax=Pseudolactococcus hodotermopsidis TaxID=2709157 RepID=A0A6A0BA82_9LACT|nr:histidine phosphatase family protein [Lactococcus hodotermopsidis]GFH42329.1 phosphoglycerate mutase [Lactococcus hodotermopsidis]